MRLPYQHSVALRAQLSVPSPGAYDVNKVCIEVLMRGAKPINPVFYSVEPVLIRVHDASDTR